MIKTYKLEDISLEDILKRDNPLDNVSEVVSEIISKVIIEKDKCLFSFCEKFDGAKLSSLCVSQEEINNAYKEVDPSLIEVIKEAYSNIYRFHSSQKRNSFIINENKGVIIGQKIIPIENVGLYVPGGTAAYPSTVLMNAIPAKIAGCKQIVITTPPNKNGNINPAVLVAADICSVDKIFKVGGAQAIAALAYGTESIPKVDKIVGPGNAFVAEAKKQVYGKVSIDMIAGPSEILIVADEHANAKFIAADLLSQAEHDKNATSVLITTSEKLATSVKKELAIQLNNLTRQEIASASIDNNGKIIICDSINQAIKISNEIAPEHLELCIVNPFDYLDSVKNAGSVFMGNYCPEPMGDYFAGPNHTLPTSGTARFSSPLSVDDFVKKMQYSYYSKDAFMDSAKKVSLFAESEGLTAHAMSELIRLEQCDE